MTQKRSLLMISGSGRSGTTILSLLLSQGADALNVGQVRNLWGALAKNVTCSCGRPLRACRFWGRLSAGLYPGADTQTFLHLQQQMLDFKADAGRLNDWSDRAGVVALAARHSAFLQGYHRLLHAIFDDSGARLLVDSSKSPEIALAAHMGDIADVYVLNLVRDPRAVACSLHKKGADVVRMMGVWRERQERLSHWREAPRLRHRRLRYEDFAAAPAATLADVLGWAGSSLPEGVITEETIAHIDWGKQHLFPPANEKVIAQKRAVQQIKAPNEWQAPQNRGLHQAALEHTAPLGRAYIEGLDGARAREGDDDTR